MKGNYVAFGIWESSESDLEALLYNVELIKHRYPSWKVIIYHDQTLPGEVLFELENLETILVDMFRSDMHPPLWKFLAANLPNVGYVVFRDKETGYSICLNGEWPKEMRQFDISSVTFGSDPENLPFNNRNSSVLSYIYTLMMPVVEMKRFIGGF